MLHIFEKEPGIEHQFLHHQQTIPVHEQWLLDLDPHVKHQLDDHYAGGHS
jgi:hypothetical protein